MNGLDSERIDQLLSRCRDARSVVRNMLDGGKFDGASHPWLREQLGAMFAEKYVLAEPAAYMQSADEQENMIVTTQHPMRHTQRNNRVRMLRVIEESTSKEAVDTVQVFGSQVRKRGYEHHDERNPHPYARVFLLPKADVYALDDFLSVVIAKLIAYVPDVPVEAQPAIVQKPIVLLNQCSEMSPDGHYWNATLHYLGLLDMRHSLQISVLDRREDAIDMVIGKLNARIVKQIPVDTRPEREPILKAGDTIFIHTTTLEKLRDYQVIFRERGVTVRMLGALGAVAKSPKELSGSFEGNAEEKMRAAQVMMAQIPDATLLQVFGLSRDQVHVMVDDSGYYVKDRRVLAFFDATDMEHLFDKDSWLAKDRPFPGVELGPLMNACNGLVNLKSRLTAAFDAVDAAYPRAKADRTLTDVACVALSKAPVFDDVLAMMSASYEAKLAYFLQHTPELEDYMMYADKEMKFISQPRPVMDADLYESKHYEVPVQDNLRGLTMAELELENPDWRRLNSVRSLAARALMSELSLSEEKGKAFIAQKRADERPFHVLLDGDERAVVMGQGLLSTPAYDGADIGLVQSLKHHAEPLRSLQDVEQLVCDVDALVLCSPMRTAELMRDKYEQAFRFWCYIVARQTHPRDVDKSVVIINEDGSYDALLDEYNALHVLGAIKEKPEILFRVITGGGVDALVSFLREERVNRVLAANYANGDVDMGAQRRNDPQIFHTAVFCSASSENKTFQDEVFMLAYDECMKGNGIVYGGGSNYMMGKIAAGALQAQHDLEAAGSSRIVALSGSNMPHLSDREGLPPEHMLKHGQYLNADTIYQRMEFMIASSDAFIVAPGGAGTMQEMTALLMLKAKRDSSMAGKDIILVNTKGFYNSVIAHISEEERCALGLHIADNMAHGRVILARIQAAK